VQDAMLAPSGGGAIRRPSSTSDSILSRTSSLRVADTRYSSKSGGDTHDRYQHDTLSPSVSIHSAPLSASSSICWTGAAAAAAGSSVECSRSSTPSPESRKRYWCRRLTRLKDEMDRFGDSFRRSLRGSVDSLATRLSPMRRRRHGGGGSGGGQRLRGNGICVDIVRDSRRRQRSKSADRSRGAAVRLDDLAAGGGGGDDDDGSRMHHSYKLPSTLTLTTLRDGAFSGEIRLDSAAASPAQSITIRIRDFRLEFYVAAEDGAAASAERPHFVGAVSLPIYIDPASLVFSLHSSDSDGGSGGSAGAHRLLVDGLMKGCGGGGVTGAGPRRLSISANDLRLPMSGAAS